MGKQVKFVGYQMVIPVIWYVVMDNLITLATDSSYRWLRWVPQHSKASCDLGTWLLPGSRYKGFAEEYVGGDPQSKTWINRMAWNILRNPFCPYLVGIFFSICSVHRPFETFAICRQRRSSQENLIYQPFTSSKSGIALYTPHLLMKPREITSF